MQNKNAISLIVLVITIIVMAILAATVIITLSNTNIIEQAGDATFRSDMNGYKEAYNLYIASKTAELKDMFDVTTLNITNSDEEYSKIFGEVPDKYKDGLKIQDGKLIFSTSDDKQKEVLKDLGMLEKPGVKEHTCEEDIRNCFIPVSGTVTTEDGETLDINDAETMSKYITLQLYYDESELQEMYKYISNYYYTVLNIEYIGIIDSEVNMAVTGFKAEDKIEVKKWNTSTKKFEDMEANMIYDNLVKINGNLSGIVAILKPR